MTRSAPQLVITSFDIDYTILGNSFRLYMRVALPVAQSPMGHADRDPSTPTIPFKQGGLHNFEGEDGSEVIGDSVARVRRARTPPAVLQALRRVRSVAPELDESLTQLRAQYAMFGDLRRRMTRQLLNSTEGDITSFPEAESPEKSLRSCRTTC